MRRTDLLARLRPALVGLCWERGYAEVELDQLCVRAGVGRPDFDHRFDDLEDCFCAVLEEMRHEFLVEVGVTVLAEPDWRSQVRAAAYAILRFWTEDIKRAHYMMVDAYTAGERASMIRDQGIEPMVFIIDRGREELPDPESLSTATAEAMAGTIYDQMRQLVAARAGIEAYREAVPRLLYTVFLPYLGRDAAAEEFSIEPPARLARGRE